MLLAYDFLDYDINVNIWILKEYICRVREEGSFIRFRLFIAKFFFSGDNIVIIDTIAECDLSIFFHFQFHAVSHM